MFLESSRYFSVQKEDVVTSDGRTVRVVRLRRLPAVTGKPAVIKENDQLDIIAQRLFANPTWFWHVADANTELWAGELTATPGRTIDLPEK